MRKLSRLQFLIGAGIVALLLFTVLFIFFPFRILEPLAPTYDDLFRHNGEYNGQTVIVRGRVLQASKADCFLCSADWWNMTITQQSSTLDDMIYINYTSKEAYRKGDIVTVIGTSDGVYNYESSMKNSVTVPFINHAVIRPYILIVVSTINSSTAIHSEPNHKSAIVRGIEKGEIIMVVGKSVDSKWLQLQDGNWVNVGLVNEVPSTLPFVE